MFDAGFLTVVGIGMPERPLGSGGGGMLDRRLASAILASLYIYGIMILVAESQVMVRLAMVVEGYCSQGPDQHGS